MQNIVYRTGGEEGLFFKVTGEKTGFVVNGHWDMIIEEFNPPVMKYRVALRPDKLIEVDDVEVSDEY